MHIKNDCKKKPAIPVQKRIKALRPGTVFMYGVYGEAAPYMRCSSGMHLGTAPNDMAVNLLTGVVFDVSAFDDETSIFFEEKPDATLLLEGCEEEDCGG